LADYQQHLGDFERRGVTVAAASVDSLEDARKCRETNGVTYPLGYGLNVREVAAATGAFFEEKRGILHATSFVVAPDRTVANASYSTGPIGRLVAKDCIGLIDFRTKQ
jgi:peroxiredoxin